MKLDTEKIKELKRQSGLTWIEIAERGGLESKQAAFEKAKGGIKNAEFFAKVFGVKPQELIKF